MTRMGEEPRTPVYVDGHMSAQNDHKDLNWLPLSGDDGACFASLVAPV